MNINAMKTNTFFYIFIILLILYSGCQNRSNKNASSKNENLPDTSTVADTGFTGIKQLYSHKLLAREFTYKNGVKQGLMKHSGTGTGILKIRQNGILMTGKSSAQRHSKMIL